MPLVTAKKTDVAEVVSSKKELHTEQADDKKNPILKKPVQLLPELNHQLRQYFRTLNQDIRAANYSDEVAKCNVKKDKTNNNFDFAAFASQGKEFIRFHSDQTMRQNGDKSAQCKCSFFCIMEAVDVNDNGKKSKSSRSTAAKGGDEKFAQLRDKALNYLDTELKKQLADKSFDLLANPTKSLMQTIDNVKEGLEKLFDEESKDEKSTSDNEDIMVVESNNLEGSKKKSWIPPCQLLVVLIIDDICLCANIGACRALMSSGAGSRLYCLNTEHTVPGNEIEEKRIC